MVTMNVVDFPEDHQCPETSSLTQIAGLRENCGVTVRVPILSKWSSVRNGTRSMEMSCGQQLQRREKDATLSDQEYNFRAQLPAEFNGHITQSRQCELSCANHLRAKSSLNCLIHFSLPSYSALKPITLSPLRCASSKKTHLISTLLFLILYTTMAVAATSLDKGPLIKTDAADFHGRTRTFLAEGSSRRSFVRRIRSQKLTARSAELRPHITGKLDFQTLKVVKRWGDLSDILLVSGRNYVYLINPALPSSPASSGEGSYMERLKWSSSVDIVNSCRLMGKRQYECQNFIRVVEVLDNGLLYVCGTNAYSPVCRSYARSNFNAPSSEDDSLYVGDEEVCHGQCESPYNPTLASATLYANTTNGFGMFTAVINDFMGNKPVLMRKSDPFVYSMDKWFNEPTFIKLVEYKDGKMYLFFRETATTIETGTSTTATYARVAQVCKNDVGGVTVLRYQWTTFLKARLKCSISGSSRGQSFTFDNLTSVSEITEIQGQGGRPMDVIFATFSTPWDWTDLPMSAVCAFSMQTIQNLFEVGNFLGEQSLQSLPLNTGGDSLSSRNSIETVVKAIPVSQYDVPSPRPGTCPGPDTSTNDRILYFAKEHFLMYDPVLPLYEQPMYVSESGVRATHVTVDSNAGYSRKPVVYVGTENGNMLRLRPRLQITTGPRSVLLEEMQIVNKTKCGVSLPCGVLALHISRPEGLNLEPSAFVAFTDRLVQVPLAACNYTNAPCCNVDPECGWQNDTCVPRTLLNDNSLPLISDMSIIPTNCEETPVNAPPEQSDRGINLVQQRSIPTSVLESSLENSVVTAKPVVYVSGAPSETVSGAGFDSLIIAGAAGFALGIFVTLILVCLVYRRRKQYSTHRITNPIEGHYKSRERLNDVEESCEPHKAGTPYFDMSGGRNRASSAGRPTSLIHEIKTEQKQLPYTPLTPTSMEDKDFPPKEDEKTAPTDTEKDGLLSADDSESSSTPLIDEVQETHLLDDINETLSKKDRAADAEKFFVPVSEKKPLVDETGHDVIPPKLPPKQSSFRKSNPPSDQFPKSATTPALNSNVNNSNNVREVSTARSPPPLSSLLLPPPPPAPKEEKEELEKEVSTPTPKRVAPRSPPPKKPPPPRPKVGIRKHETFSGSHGQRIKPPVPPKSSSLLRASSMRSPPAVKPFIEDLHASPSSRDDQEAHTFPASPEDDGSQEPKRLSLNRRGRTPSFKYNSAANRPKSKSLVAVAPPVVPPNP